MVNEKIWRGMFRDLVSFGIKVPKDADPFSIQNLWISEWRESKAFRDYILKQDGLDPKDFESKQFISKLRYKKRKKKGV